MRRQFVAGAAEGAGAGLGQLLSQVGELTCQRVDLLLLANDDLVQLVEQVFAEAGLDFEIGQPLVDDLAGRVGGTGGERVGVVHGLIGHETRLAGVLHAGGTGQSGPAFQGCVL